MIVSNLDLFYKESLVQNIHMSIAERSINGLLAKNGSGKTTLLRTIAGLREEKKGSVKIIDASKILAFKEMKKKLFYFETSEWFDGNVSGYDYLQYYQKLWKPSKAKSPSIDSMVHFWEMRSYIKKPIKRYSLGMKQKILLSLYEVTDATYWLMDEPTIGLDGVSVAKFDHFLQEAKNQGKAILFSTHDRSSIQKNCDTIYEIENQRGRKN